MQIITALWYDNVTNTSVGGLLKFVPILHYISISNFMRDEIYWWRFGSAILHNEQQLHLIVHAVNLQFYMVNGVTLYPSKTEMT